MEEVKQGYKQTDIGMIPEDWEIVKFSQLGIPTKSRINPKIETDNFKCIELEHINQETGLLNGYANSKDLLSQKAIFEKGDVLFGKLRPYLKKYWFAEFDGICTTEIWVLKPTRKVLNKYLFYIVQSDRIIESANLSTGTKMPRAEWKVVGKTELAVSNNLIEQTAIATALSDTDALIAALDKKIAKKQQIKQGAMQQLMKPKSDWNLSKLGDMTKIFTKQTGFDYSAYIKPSLIQAKTNDNIPFIQNKDFKNKWINFDTDYFIPLTVAKQFPKILLDEKSLLISISGSVGNVGVYESPNLAFIGGAVAILKFKDPEVIDWVMFYLNSEVGQRKLLDNVKAGSHQNLILDDIRKIEILLPPTKMQTLIAQILTDMDNEITQLEKERDKYKEIKAGMMQVLLTGKVRLV